MPQVTALSRFANNNLPTIYGDCAGDKIVNEFFIDLTAAQLVANNIFDVGILPAFHTVVDAVLITDDLDSNGTPLVSLDVGLLTGTPGDNVSSTRVCGAEFFSADTTARTGGVSRMSLASGFRVQPTGTDRSIGLKVNAAPATAAAAGRVRLLVSMAPMDPTIAF